MADARTPMAWQHRDMNYPPAAAMQKSSGENSRNRYTPTPSSRYGGPPTPNSAHSRHSRTPDHRRDARGSSSERYKFFLGLQNCFSLSAQWAVKIAMRAFKSCPAIRKRGTVGQIGPYLSKKLQFQPNITILQYFLFQNKQFPIFFKPCT